MTVPTLDELHSHVEEVIAGRQPEGKFYVFEWEYLINMSWRPFRTTSRAIAPRMKQLLEQGRLVRVSVSHHGFVYLVENDLSTYGTLYFQYTNDHREDYGFVTANRISNRKNVWRDGYRYLYTTTAQHERMKAHFLKLSKERNARAEAKEAAERVRLWEMLESATPGARQVLDDLYKTLKGDGGRRPEVSTFLHEHRGEEHPQVDINTRNMEQSVRLIDIIRRGLVDKEKGT